MPSAEGDVPFLVAATLSEGLLGVMGLGLCHYGGLPIGAWLGVDASVVAWCAVGVVPSLLLIPWSLRSTWPPLIAFRAEVEEMVVPMFEGMGVASMLWISLMAGAGEELLFRLWLQQALTGAVGPLGGLLLASLLFGLAHPISRLYVVTAAAIGAWLGLLMLASGSLVPAIFVHAVHDAAALTWMVPRR